MHARKRKERKIIHHEDVRDVLRRVKGLPEGESDEDNKQEHAAWKREHAGLKYLRKPRGKSVIGRKEKRKAKRQEEKKRKREYHESKKVRFAADVASEAENDDAQEIIEPARKKQKLTHTPATKSNFMKLLAQNGLVSSQGDEEDAEILRLEKMLGINKKKNWKKAFEADGLDYLLDFTDSAKKGEYQTQDSEVTNDTLHDEDEEEDFRDAEEDNQSEDLPNDTGDELANDDSNPTSSDQDESSGRQSADTHTSAAQPWRPRIAGALDGMAPLGPMQQQLQRRVRGLLNRVSEANLEAITTELEGLYTAHSRKEVSDMLCQSLLFDCRHGTVLRNFAMIYAGFVAVVANRITAEFGAQFLEALVKALADDLEEIASGNAANDNDDDSQRANARKSANHFTLVLAHLYNFQVVASGLLHDYIKLLLERFGEPDIDLLLSLLRNCGFQLRADDPASLKQMIVLIQQKAAQWKEARAAVTAALKPKGSDDEIDDEQSLQRSHALKVQFLIDLIGDIKNNKQRLVEENSQVRELRKVVKEVGSGTSSVRRKKTAKSRSGGLLHEPFKMSWDDLIEADTRGRWWLVGSAWAGRRDTGISRTGGGSCGPSGSAQPQEQLVERMLDTLEGTAAGKGESELMELARAQRMNTDTRRAVFCVIMGSSDYLDAFEKLLKLQLKDKEEREIATVLVHCCTSEASGFNPYYLHLARKLLSFKRHFRFTFQVVFWDHFKKLDQMSPVQMANLAKLLAHLVASFALSLSLLKVIEFDNLGEVERKFFRMFFKFLLLSFDEKTVRGVFQRIAAVKELFVTREALTLFLWTGLGVSPDKRFEGNSIEDAQAKLLRKRIKMAKSALQNEDELPI